MCAQLGKRERMLTDDERALLEHVRTGLAELPIVARGDQWGWEFRAIRNTTDYDTEEEARTMFSRYLAVLTDAQRAESEQRYTPSSTLRHE